MKNNIFIFLSCVLFFGCATVSNEVSLKKMLPQQRIYAGRMSVTMNGQPATKCEIYLNLDVAPSIKVAADGIIYYKTDREKLKLRALACYYLADKGLAAWHHKSLPLSAVIRSGAQEEISYMGHLQVQWKVSDDETIEAAKKDYEQGSAVRVGRVNDSGELQVSVSDEMSVVETQFYNLHPEAKDKGYKFVSRVLTVNHDE